MKAARIHEFGSPEVIRIDDVPQPTPNEGQILIDPFLSDNPSRDNGWSGYLTGKNSTQGGDR